ncbi:hypothetical protein [Holdemanella biformis]|uniref:hypothetical protein n=1 Tax=Holdemanella biformis TaxID=1735 RepID=UPI00242C3A39|nr:hypothetical protein [Holdemanella biformis]MBS6258816.1 hypothetical protein [Holdemanella biformis]
MARQFLRQNNLHNVVGRIEYIRGDTGKQEHMMAYYSTMSDEDWKNLAQYNQERFKKNKKGFNKNKKCSAIEARELILHIPHEYANRDPHELAKLVGDDWKKRFGTDCCLAIHWNKTKTNYHIHLIYSERVRENKVATRNMYYDSKWKKCKKADAVNIIKKGDIVSKWSDKDTRFKQKVFMQDVIKPYYAAKFKLEVYKDDGLHLKEQKEYKINPTSSLEYIELHDKIVEYNKNVRTWNNMVDDVLERSPEYCVLHPSDHNTVVNKSKMNLPPTKENEYTLFIDTVMKPAVTAHKKQRKHHKEYLKYMIERVKEALNALVERFKLNASKQSTTNNISIKNYAQITKQKPFKPQMKKKTNKSISKFIKHQSDFERD